MTTQTTEREMPRLKARYRAELEQRLKYELGLGNIMQVPRPLKVVVNMVIGEAIREGQSIGAKVTLRGDRMWEFLDRLISIVLPRIRDFRGLNPRTFDGHGNFTFGLTEQLVFPEIDYDKIEKVRGMDITVVTSAETDDQGRALLTALGFPFRSV